jgi:hypothetical protein
VQEEGYLRLYDGLPWRELVYDDRWLIVIIEALWYCQSRRKDYIRFNPLKCRCNEAIWRLSKALGKREISSIPDGTFASIIDSDRCKKYFTVERVEVKSKKGTWVTENRIHPHTQEIEQEIRSRKIENLAYGDGSLTIRNKHHKINCVMPIFEPALKVSDGVSVVVTRANQQKRKQLKK